MFERARAIAKRRAEIDETEYNDWLFKNGYLLPGAVAPSAFAEKSVSKPHENSVLGGQLDPDELKDVYDEWIQRGQN